MVRVFRVDAEVKDSRFYLVSILTGAIVFIAAAYCIIRFESSKAESRLPGSVVKVVLAGGGHGSGVHIGKGYILTAAHVVAESKTLKIKTDTGATGEADVLWFNKDHDIALIHTGTNLQVSQIACEPIVSGSLTRATGNPANQEFISTWGRVSGRAIGTPWKVAIVADITIVPGMSGGGLFDEAGRLVGILVGTMARGFGAIIPIGYVVPASAFCGMLGR